MTRLLSVTALSVSAGFLLLASPVAKARAQAANGPAYRPSAIAHCLTEHGVGGGLPNRGSQPESASQKALDKQLEKLQPPGITGTVLMTQLFGPKVDGAVFYFFRTAALARKGEARLVATKLLLRGVPTTLATLFRAAGAVPPSAAAARDLHRVVGNVVLLWGYPRRHSAVSDRIVSACFATAHQ